jgi:2-aminophenol/2-amino-5-chlorophenol 1,6-dioxygenase alpha subunit
MKGRCHLGALVPGLPHLLRGDLNPQYADLAKAVSEVGDWLAGEGVTRLVYFSTKWLSVLGQMYQGRRTLQGRHVDEMWYDLGDLPFDFDVDRPFAEAMAAFAKQESHQTQIVDYEGFPVDTGTIVADRLLNRGRFCVNMVACSLYLDLQGMELFAHTVRQAIGKDAQKTAVIGVSGLSGHWHRRIINYADDTGLSETDDVYNRRFLGMLEAGTIRGCLDLLPEYGRLCHVDMGGKALPFLVGAGVAAEGRKAHVRAYGSIYGTGAAVVSFPAP